MTTLDGHFQYLLIIFMIFSLYIPKFRPSFSLHLYIKFRLPFPNIFLRSLKIEFYQHTKTDILPGCRRTGRTQPCLVLIDDSPF